LAQKEISRLFPGKSARIAKELANLEEEGADMEIVGITSHSGEGGGSSLGHEYLLTDSDHLIRTSAPNDGHSSGSKVNSNHSSPAPSLAGPVSTLVGSSQGLEINLVWDSSVRSSANWSAIEAAVVSAAEIYTQTFSNHIVVNIGVGLGEIDGSSLSSNALGESDSYGYIAKYATVASALNTADSSLTSHGLMSSNALSVDSPPSTANYFVTSAEAKALGLVSGSSTAIDGYIGLANSSSLFFGSGKIGSSQYDAVGVAAHEISEVMGRIGTEGASLGSTKDVYTPLDLFRYEAPNVRDLSDGTGYFSTTDGSGGATSSNTYNNGQNGGDASDWASIGAANAVVNDSYDAFDTPGVITHVSSTDLLEDASLGYTVNSTGLADIIDKSVIVA
jgi:hypothetical protein